MKEHDKNTMQTKAASWEQWTRY